jgi:hypothetical protein
MGCGIVVAEGAAPIAGAGDGAAGVGSATLRAVLVLCGGAWPARPAHWEIA